MNLPQPLQRGRFLRRLNRFAAEVRLGRRTVRAHVANSGRLGELLVEDAEVYVHPVQRNGRVTTHDLALVRFGEALVSIDSRAPSAIAGEALRAGMVAPPGKPEELRSEVPFGEGRIDLWARAGGHEWFIEVKGCTLVRARTAIFPDAPTLRGRRHVEELTACAGHGGRAMLLFVIQRDDADELRPNWQTDPGFAQALVAASSSGVVLRAYRCSMTVAEATLAQAVPVRLDPPDARGAAHGCV